ncbi:ROK family protein [Sporomusa sp. GT1]|uniref:ROK family protein n=1 Tax=Sporomusa sp. GT1 TaxID=1534747 RepID=UPI00166AC7CB|nr:ROK family protein [Sporomusa sp. GT1]
MAQLTSNSAQIKCINVELVKTTLKNLATGTKQDVAKATGLSVATCNTILNELVETGEVLADELAPSYSGRPARQYTFNANYSLIACIYMYNKNGTHTITYTVVNLKGEILEEHCVQKKISYEKIENVIDELLERYTNIKAVGIGVPGLVNQGVVGVCDIDELVGIPLGLLLKEKYLLKITIGNGTNLTALGFYHNQGYQEETIVTIHFSKKNYPGAGIIVDGRILQGSTGFAGEISFLPYDCSREEQLKQLNSNEGFIPLVVKTICSFIAVINPSSIMMVGDLFATEMLDEIRASCLKFIPQEHMPSLFLSASYHEVYMRGLIFKTLESLTYNIELIEKKI